MSSQVDAISRQKFLTTTQQQAYSHPAKKKNRSEVTKPFSICFSSRKSSLS